MRQFLVKICLTSSLFFMTSCSMFDGMFAGDEDELKEEAPVVVDAEDTKNTEEDAESEPIVLEDVVETGEIDRLPARSEGPHILKRDGKFWIIAESSAHLSGVLKTLGNNV